MELARRTCVRTGTIFWLGPSTHVSLMKSLFERIEKEIVVVYENLVGQPWKFLWTVCEMTFSEPRASKGFARDENKS